MAWGRYRHVECDEARLRDMVQKARWKRREEVHDYVQMGNGMHCHGERSRRAGASGLCICHQRGTSKLLDVMGEARARENSLCKEEGLMCGIAWFGKVHLEWWH